MTNHKSDCAVHNEPAMKAGPCDCGADSIVEAVARALYDEAVKINERHRMIPLPPYEHDKNGFYSQQARAALTAFLDCMREPSEGMREAPRKHGQIGPMGANEVWQAMLDQLRKEALGDGTAQ